MTVARIHSITYHFFNASFTHTAAVSQTRLHFFLKKVGISPEKSFLISRSFMILFMVSVDTGLKVKWAFNFEFLLLLYTLVKGKFFNSGVNMIFKYLQTN